MVGVGVEETGRVPVGVDVNVEVGVGLLVGVLAGVAVKVGVGVGVEESPICKVNESAFPPDPHVQT